MNGDSRELARRPPTVYSFRSRSGCEVDTWDRTHKSHSTLEAHRRPLLQVFRCIPPFKPLEPPQILLKIRETSQLTGEIRAPNG